MDRVGLSYSAATMPPRAPLPMVQQEFGRDHIHSNNALVTEIQIAPFRGEAQSRRPVGAERRGATVPVARSTYSERRTSLTDVLWRIAAFGPALIITCLFLWGIGHGLARGGMTALEVSVVFLAGLTCVWILLAVSTVIVGLVRVSFFEPPRAPHHGPRTAQNIAILIPLYNEPAADVFGNASAMIQNLMHPSARDQFTLFFLSDTRDATSAQEEEKTFAHLKASLPNTVPVYYRRRLHNTDRKVGNISDWIENWGAAYEAMVVLDADSLMSGAALRHLGDEMAADPSAGLIQSFPALIGAETLFGRMQEFSNAVYGWLLAEGLAGWARREGNYWGHNAIIRTRAFAESAHLPRLRSWRGPGTAILSHDFVEAGMLRRAGWGVKFARHQGGSYEEAPQTLIDYALRDRRWCQGNLQHLRLLTARGFHPISRFHLLQGAVAFLLSPAWFALILIWAMLGNMADMPVVYFSPENPLHPIWPEGAAPSGLVYLGFIYTMLLLPKLIGVSVLSLQPRIRRAYGGGQGLALTTLFEVICSIIYAPILMVQQSIAVGLALIGRSHGWAPQRRGAQEGYGWRVLIRFHALETVIGFTMLAGILFSTTSLWLLPIAISLTLAVPLSALSALSMGARMPKALHLNSPQALHVPRIVQHAQVERAKMRAWLAARREAAHIAAE